VDCLEKIHIRDSIYDEIPVYREIEEPVINKWEIQRLRYIKQLQLTYLVYPTALHTRFDHSLGVMHIASEFLEHVLDNADNIDILKKPAELEVVSDNVFRLFNRVVARLAGLLHDIGHGPLGHLFDEYIVPNILKNKLDVLDKKCFSHEVISFLIYWHRLRDDIKKILEKIDVFKRFTDVLIEWLDQIMIPICWDRDTGKSIYHDEFKVNTSGYGYFIRMIVRDYLYPADLLDYLIRDSKFTGTIELGFINRLRLMRYTKPISYDQVIDKIPSTGKNPPTPILMVLDEKALGDLIRYLDARKLMYENVYLHKAIKAFDWSAIKILSEDEVWYHIGFNKDLLIKAIEKPRDSSIVNAFLDEYLDLTDHVLLKIRDLVKRNNIKNEVVKEHVKALFDYRKPLYKSIHSELIPATPHLLENSRISTRIYEFEEELRKTIVDKINSPDLYEQIIVGIEQIQIYPGTAWNIQGPSVYTTIDGSIRVYTIEDFSEKYHISNIGIIRLYIDRSLIEPQRRRFINELMKVFINEVKDNSENRKKLEELIGIITISTITM